MGTITCILFSGGGYGGAGREGVGGVREEGCTLIFSSAEHLAIACLVKFGLSFRQCFLN